MRTAIIITAIAIALGAGTVTRASAQVSVTHPGAGVTCVLTAEVKSFVRMVAIPADPSTGAPPRMMVVTNDPRIRAAQAQRPLTRETLPPTSMVYTIEGPGHGGESAIRGRFDGGVTTVRYTLTTP